MKRSFSRVAIVNRGEAALRFIHAALELNREGERLHTIALYTEPDRHALFVREADEAWDLGPAMVEGGDGRRKVAYVDLARLEEALRATRAEAAWPGWGFVAEQPEFAELCERLGVTFIGPSPAAMRALGDKIASKRLAEGLGIPVVPWAGAPAASEAEAARQAAELGFPRDGEGHGRHRRPRGERRGDGGDAALRPEGRARRGLEVVRPGHRVPGAAPRRRPARRRPGDERRLGRGVGAARARGLDPAAAPEAGRGVAGPGPAPGARGGDAAGRRPPRAGGGLRGRRRRSSSCTTRERGLLVPRGEHAARGRARRLRGHDRPRPREAAGPRRARRTPARRAAGGRGPRGRGAPVRRGRGGRLRAGARHRRPPAAPRRAGAARRRRRRGGRPRAGRVRLDDREADRPRARPRGGAGAPRPRPLADRGHPARGHHEQGVPARPAGPRGGARGARRRALPRPPGGARRAELAAPRRARPGAGGDRGLRDGGGRREGPLPLDRGARPARGAARDLAHRRAAAGRAGLRRRRAPDRGRPLPGRGERPPRRRGGRAAGLAAARAAAPDLRVAPAVRRVDLARALARPGPLAPRRGRGRSPHVHPRRAGPRGGAGARRSWCRWRCSRATRSRRASRCSSSRR